MGLERLYDAVHQMVPINANHYTLHAAPVQVPSHLATAARTTLLLFVLAPSAYNKPSAYCWLLALGFLLLIPLLNI